MGRDLFLGSSLLFVYPLRQPVCFWIERSSLPVFNHIFSRNIYNHIVLEVGSAITYNLYRVPKPHHDLFEEESGCLLQVISLGCPGFYPPDCVVSR